MVFHRSDSKSPNVFIIFLSILADLNWSSLVHSFLSPPVPLLIIWGRHQLYDHLPPITKTIQVRRTRHTGHCWRSKDELISDVLLWTPTYGQTKAGRQARTYIQQLCEYKGCNPEDLPKAMNDREKWPGISVLATWHDDDDDDQVHYIHLVLPPPSSSIFFSYIIWSRYLSFFSFSFIQSFSLFVSFWYQC